MQSSKIITLTATNSLLSITTTGQIIKLNLDSYPIITDIPPSQNFDAGGSFIMFPWVGRIRP